MVWQEYKTRLSKGWHWNWRRAEVLSWSGKSLLISCFSDVVVSLCPTLSVLDTVCVSNMPRMGQYRGPTILFKCLSERISQREQPRCLIRDPGCPLMTKVCRIEYWMYCTRIRKAFPPTPTATAHASGMLTLSSTEWRARRRWRGRRWST